MNPEDAIFLGKIRRALGTPFVCPVQVGPLRMSRATARMIEANLTRKPARSQGKRASAAASMSPLADGGANLSPCPSGPHGRAGEVSNLLSSPDLSGAFSNLNHAHGDTHD